MEPDPGSGAGAVITDPAVRTQSEAGRRWTGWGELCAPEEAQCAFAPGKETAPHGGRKKEWTPFDVHPTGGDGRPEEMEIAISLSHRVFVF